jgi:DnaJ C terminal domain
VATFRDAVYDILTHIFNSKYYSRGDIDRFNADLYIIAKSASADFEVLKPIILRTASPSFSPSSMNRQKLLDLGDRIYNHSKDLHKVLDQIEGREDWSGLSPKPPSTPTPRGKDSARTAKRVTFTPSTGSSSGRSARSSPSILQPTVEEATDLGEDDDNHGVRAYHMDPEDFNRKSPSHSSNDEKSSPPRVVIRQATDPNQLEPVLKTLNFDDPPQKSPKGLNMFTTDQRTDFVGSPSHQDDQFSLIGSSSRPRSNEHLYDEIRQREDELRKLKEEFHSSGSESSLSPQGYKGKQTLSNRDDDLFGIKTQLDSQSSDEMSKFKNSLPSSSSSSNYYSAQSKRNSLDYGRPSNNSSSSLRVPDATSRPRQRAATMSTTESARRPDLGLDTSGLPRPPHISPRYSPYASSSEYPSPRFRNSAFDAFTNRSSNSSKESMYGTPHNTSLPTVLEHGNQRETSDRNKKRASWSAAPEYFDDGDFPLFDSSDPPSTQNLFKTPSAPSTSSATKSDTKSNTKPGTITQDLQVSLMDLFTGTKKRVQVQRLLPDSMSGELHTFSEVFEVQVYAGLNPGSRVTISGRGDFVPERQSYGDLVFILVEKPHDEFERDGRNLILRVEVSLYESLCGWTRSVDTICGRKLKVSPQRLTPAGDMVQVGSYGMPKFVGKDMPPGSRGQLLLKVDVKWPTTGFDSRQRQLLRQALIEGGRSPRR